jgi:hypothetical protein
MTQQELDDFVASVNELDDYDRAYATLCLLTSDNNTWIGTFKKKASVFRVGDRRVWLYEREPRKDRKNFCAYAQ